MQCRPYNLAATKHIRDLDPSDIDKLVCIKGMVTRTSAIIPNLRCVRAPTIHFASASRPHLHSTSFLALVPSQPSSLPWNWCSVGLYYCPFSDALVLVFCVAGTPCLSAQHVLTRWRPPTSTVVLRTQLPALTARRSGAWSCSTTRVRTQTSSSSKCRHVKRWGPSHRNEDIKIA